MVRSLLPFAALLATGLSWGATVSLATLATADGHHPMSVALWNAGVGLAILSVVLLIRGKRPPIDGAWLIFYAVTGLIGTAAPHTLTFFAADNLPAGPRAVVYALIPMMTLLGSVLIGLERARLRRFAGLLIGFVAVGLMIDPNFQAAGPDHVFWMGCALAAVTCYAVENLYVAKRRPPHVDTPTMLWGVTFASMLWLIPALAAMDLPILPPTRIDRDEAALLAMAGLHLGAYGGLFFMIQRAGAVFASQVSYVVTPAGVLWGLVLLDESLSLRVALATGLVLVGLSLIRPNPIEAPAPTNDRSSPPT
ncbi:MAG: DMT family transporter [Nitratireductor sp.]